MSVPSVKDIRDYLECYGIDKSTLSDAWIEARRDNFIVPYVEKITRQSFRGVQTVTEFYSGNGGNILSLNRRPFIAVTSIQYVLGGNNIYFINLNTIEQITAEGILKSKINYDESSWYLPVFAKGEKNLKVTYTYGYADYPADVAEAVIYLTAYQVLNFVGARTGGGSVGIQAYSRTYGTYGKYTDIMRHLSTDAHALLRKYMSSSVGS